MSVRILTLLLLTLDSLSSHAFGFELQPLTTRNLSPATIGYGLPALGPATTLPSDSGQFQLALDLASNADIKTTGTENLIFDGETYRVALSFDYGINDDWELGIELPLVSHQGGFLDNFIAAWHDTFGLPQGTRDQMPTNRLDYSYNRLGGQSFNLQSGATAPGDLALRSAWQIWHDEAGMRALALRASLKLPTGNTKKLTGSGSTDLAVWLSGEQRLRTAAGEILLYGGGGGLFSSDGNLLSDQRNNLVGLASLGCGWQPWPGLGFQLQFDGHTPLYRQSGLPELGNFAGQLAIGGSLSLGEQTSLELAVVEDVIVDTAPDVAFHLVLRRQL